jgi:hypothetical protein
LRLRPSVALSGAGDCASGDEAQLRFANHDPDFAAHVDQVESVVRQLAERLRIGGQNRRQSATRRIFDFVAICQIEMPHGITDSVMVFDEAGGNYMAIGPASMVDENRTKCNAIIFCKIARVSETMALSDAENSAFSIRSDD